MKSTSMKRKLIINIQRKDFHVETYSTAYEIHAFDSPAFSREHSTRMLTFKLEAGSMAFIRPTVHIDARRRHDGTTVVSAAGVNAAPQLSEVDFK